MLTSAARRSSYACLATIAPTFRGKFQAEAFTNIALCVDMLPVPNPSDLWFETGRTSRTFWGPARRVEADGNVVVVCVRDCGIIFIFHIVGMVILYIGWRVAEKSIRQQHLGWILLTVAMLIANRWRRRRD